MDDKITNKLIVELLRNNDVFDKVYYVNNLFENKRNIFYLYVSFIVNSFFIKINN